MAFWNIVNDVIKNADILIEVLDARFPDLSRNEEIEQKIIRSEKKLLIVVNKCDLVNKEKAEEIKKKLRKVAPTVFISSTKHLGTTFLRENIMKLSKGHQIRVGVLGYPNTGKSSLINALRGRQAAKTSSMSGYTKFKQAVRVSKKILMLDTPGVYSSDKKDKANLFLFSAVDHTKLKHPESVAFTLLDNFKERICKHYEIEDDKDQEVILENLAKRINKFKKGGIPDTFSAAKELLKDWQMNKIK